MNKLLRLVIAPALISVMAMTVGIRSALAEEESALSHSDQCRQGDETGQAIPSASYPFEDKYVLIDGHKVHYVEAGHGRPIIFLHGNPTWSYIWRNVFPCVAKQTHRRAIAIDLLGLGRSDKPVLDYTPQLHTEILRKFIDKLHLHDVILVGHDWGGPIMTNYAVHHPGKVGGLIFMETFVWKLNFSDFGFIEPVFRLARTPEGQDLMINNKTWYVENLIKPGVLNQAHFTDEVFAHYLEPFPTPGSRTAMAKFPRLIPILEDPQTLQVSIDFFDEIDRGLEALAHKPLLWIKATPGSLVSDASANKFNAFRARLPQVEVKEFGAGIHPLQEDDPQKVVSLMAQWLEENGLAGHRHRNEEKD